METIIADLEAVFMDADRAVRLFLERPIVTARSLFVRRHLLLLCLFPLFAALCPYRWAQGGALSWKWHVLTPLVLTLAFFGLAMVYDKILEYGRGPAMLEVDGVEMKNVSLFLHLPLAGAGFFALFAPVVGFGMVLFAGGYSIFLSVCVNARLRGISGRSAGVYYLFAVVGVAMVLFVVALFSNLIWQFV